MNTDALNLNVGINARPLRSTLHRLAAGIAVLTLASPLLAWADCVDMRKPTAAETDFYNRAWAALVAALPPVPVGATRGSHQDSFERVPTMGQKCADEKIGDFEILAQRSYVIIARNTYYNQNATVRVTMNVRKFPVPDKDPSAAYGAASPGRSAGLKVYNVVWSIDGGSSSPLGKVVAGALDRARLEAMVGKPLPSVAESQAFAAQAVPATVAAATVAAPAAAAGPAPATQSAAQPVAAQPAGQPPASDPTRDAVDTVNRLRGLFGR